MSKALRPDITGLRAIAVIAVTAYHIVHIINPHSSWFAGGFVGVDVFFVISGYLMTMLIMRDLSLGRFSLYEFYKRRAQRICPALLVVVLLVLGLGVLIIGTEDLIRLAFAGGWALLMSSNFYFAFYTDYFANAALDQPLLHTWSLGVEWQFYLIHPLILLLLRRYCVPSLLARSFLVLTLLWLGLGLYGATVFPKYAYYLLPMRGGELMVGGLAFFYPLHKFKAWLMAHWSQMPKSSLRNHVAPGVLVSNHQSDGHQAKRFTDHSQLAEGNALVAADFSKSDTSKSDAAQSENRILSGQEASAHESDHYNSNAHELSAHKLSTYESSVHPASDPAGTCERNDVHDSNKDSGQDGGQDEINDNVSISQSRWSVLYRLVEQAKPWQGELLGLALIVYAVFRVEAQAGWPNFNVIWPLLGTYLCIAVNHQRTCLRFKVFQKLGLWSYAIYLVHWPILVLVTKLGFAWDWQLDSLPLGSTNAMGLTDSMVASDSANGLTGGGAASVTDAWSGAGAGSNALVANSADEAVSAQMPAANSINSTGADGADSFMAQLQMVAGVLGLLGLIIISGGLLHQLVEKRRNYGYPTLLVYVVGTFACFYVALTGVVQRLAFPVSQYAQYGGHGIPFDGLIHEIGDFKRAPDFILIGDSFARHYTLDLQDRQLHVITVLTDGCYSFARHVNLRPEGKVAQNCQIRYQQALQALAQYPNIPVVFAQDWPRYASSLVKRPADNLANITATLAQSTALAKTNATGSSLDQASSSRTLLGSVYAPANANEAVTHQTVTQPSTGKIAPTFEPALAPAHEATTTQQGNELFSKQMNEPTNEPSFDNAVAQVKGSAQDPSCDRANAKADAQAEVESANLPFESKRVFKLSSRQYVAAVAEDLAALAQALGHRPVYILGTPLQPVYDMGSTCMYLHALNNPLSRWLRQNVTCRPHYALRDIAFNAWLEREVQQYPNFTYLDPNEALCSGNDCELLVDGVLPVYQDGLHYSWAGSVKVVSYLLFRMGLPQGRLRLRFEDVRSLEQKPPQITLGSVPKAQIDRMQELGGQDSMPVDNIQERLGTANDSESKVGYQPIPPSAVSPVHTQFLGH